MRVHHAIAALCAIGLAAAAEDSVSGMTGLDVAKEMEARDEGFGDFTADLEMILRNKHGDESVRHFSMRVLEQIEDGDKSLVVFDRPPDIKGTALLSFSHKTGDDDQWLYLPALNRVKRISSSNQSGPFMGSEFAYEDMTSQEVEKYTYGDTVEEEEINDHACLKFERVPVHPKSGYTRQIVWVRKDIYRIARIDYYDRKNALLKTYLAYDFEQFLDKHWRATRMVMENHQTGKATELLWHNFQFQTGLTERDFDRNSLARAR